MPDEKSFQPMEYVCPICGERTTFGSHFCKGERAPKAASRFGEALKRGAIILVGLVLVEAMLWQMIGLYSLYALAGFALIGLALLAIRSSPLGRSSREYRELLKMAGGDKEAAERLIAMEKLKRPGRSQTEAVRMALDAWRRDIR
jgi:hypothetical protein